MITCKNCRNVFEGKYGNQCDRSTTNKHIDHTQVLK